MTIKEDAAKVFTKTYPHVGEIADPPTQQTIRLLWDRIHDLEARLSTSEGTVTKLVSGHNTNEASITKASQIARYAVGLFQKPGTPPTSVTAGGEPLPGGGDGGAGEIGCGGAGPTGHDTGGLLNAIRAGQIVCGTGNEFPALKNPTATDAQREANMIELLRRMIWHLKQAGFTAGRQKNPSGRVSSDKLCVEVEGVVRVYDVFIGAAATDPLKTHMGETAPANMQDDAGIPD